MRTLRVFKILAVNFLVLLTLLVLLECGLRIFHYPFKTDWEPLENSLARFDSLLGWSYVPNMAKAVDFETYRRDVYTDGDGIRVSAANYSFQVKTPTALFIGCSYTMGHGLSYQESYVGRFAALADGRLQTVNLGVQAYGTDQSLLILKKFINKFNTKVVIYTFMDEHISRNGNYDRRMFMPDARFIGTKPLFELDEKGELYLAKKPLLYKDYLHSWLFDALILKIGPHLSVYPPYPEQLTHALILEMNRLCKERNIRFILLNWRWNETGYNNFDTVRVEKVDTMLFAPQKWEHLRIPGDNHPDAEAGRIVADFLYNYLQPLFKSHQSEK